MIFFTECANTLFEIKCTSRGKVCDIKTILRKLISQSHVPTDALCRKHCISYTTCTYNVKLRRVRVTTDQTQLCVAFILLLNST